MVGLRGQIERDDKVSVLDKVPSSWRQTVRRNGRKVLLEGSILLRKRESDRCSPDFLIVGAQRCGTTSLFRALSKHPAMMPNVLGAKGVHYFDTDFARDRTWYFSHFPSLSEKERHAANTGQRPVVGEASPYYLFHPAGAERMARVVPDAKIIVMLRDPVKRAISHHLHMVWEGHEPVKDLDKALDLESSRLDGIDQKLLANPELVSRAHQHFSYVSRGRYAEQLERLYDHFERDNVMVLATENLAMESQRLLDNIQRFIGLEPDPAIVLERRNSSASFQPRSETLDRLASEFDEPNKQLAALVDDDIPWLSGIASKQQ